MNRKIGQHPDEERFESHIEKHLNSIGFNSIEFKNFDKNLCLIPEEFISFIKSSQPNEYEKYKNTPDETEKNS